MFISSCVVVVVCENLHRYHRKETVVDGLVQHTKTFSTTRVIQATTTAWSEKDHGLC